MREIKNFVISKGTHIRESDFSAEIIEARREWNDIFKVRREKKMPTKNILSGKERKAFRKESLSLTLILWTIKCVNIPVMPI